MLRTVSIAVAAALAAIVALGPADAQPQNFQPVSLTQDSATRALNAMPDVYQVAQQYGNSAAASGGDDPLGGFANVAAYAAAQADLSAAVGPHGFSGYQDWVAVIQTIFHTYAYVQAGPAMQQMAPMMDQAMQQILNNPSIPQAQKDAIIAQMGVAGSAHSAMQANPPSPENQAVVAAVGPQIEQMVNWMRTQP